MAVTQKTLQSPKISIPTTFLVAWLDFHFSDFPKQKPPFPKNSLVDISRTNTRTPFPCHIVVPKCKYNLKEASYELSNAKYGNRSRAV